MSSTCSATLKTGHDRVCAPRASRVIGLDLSEASLAHARSIAQRAGADVEFVHANVYDAREKVSGDFDLVYASIGVLCWLPDITQWARVVASLLKPGGASSSAMTTRCS